MIKVLVVGYGSIGSRHARILTDMGYSVSVVSSRVVEFPHVFKSLDAALENQKFEYVVLANKTVEHYETLLRLVGHEFKGLVLMEKPLFDYEYKLPEFDFSRWYVAYNLRLHPLIQRIREIILKEKTLSVQVYVGQYLPTWRPDSDYRISYSAKKNDGGGVLRDLSHELDYILWLFGDWKRVSALGGKFSSLEIDSHDIFAFLLSTRLCPVVSVQMNYLDRKARREIIIITDNHSYKIDLVNGFLWRDEVVEKIETSRDFTYILQHKAVLSENDDNLCSLATGNEVLRCIAAIEKSAEVERWISNEYYMYDLC
ncbi:MAG: Gfo/Idh/MocA family oxidoreductase [Bacillota bacterium]